MNCTLNCAFTMIAVCCFVISVAFCGISEAAQLDSKQVVIVVLSQNEKYHEAQALRLKEDIIIQALEIGEKRPQIYLSHETFDHAGSWTIFPLVPKLAAKQSKALWYVFCEETTRIKWKKLLETLDFYDNKQKLWLGHGMYDSDGGTIVHHFANANNPKALQYPNLAVGLALSNTMLSWLAEKIQQHRREDPQFSIDPAHELATFVKKHRGPDFVHDEAFCIVNHWSCATHPAQFTTCGSPVPENSIYFAVKTCPKFHKTRLPVIKKTWGRFANNIKYFSPVADESIPTVYQGVPNSDGGHCSKTMSILRLVADEIKHKPSIKWIMLCDDDTILSVARLAETLSCYNPNNPVALGERYGYALNSDYGYNYITGGGGTVLSVPLLKTITAPGVCECPKPLDADDMFMGQCFARLGISVTHSPDFHQARPEDYPHKYLASKHIVSFHRHWSTDPYMIYAEWFLDADKAMLARPIQHIEL